MQAGSQLQMELIRYTQTFFRRPDGAPTHRERDYAPLYRNVMLLPPQMVLQHANEPCYLCRISVLIRLALGFLPSLFLLTVDLRVSIPERSIAGPAHVEYLLSVVSQPVPDPTGTPQAFQLF